MTSEWIGYFALALSLVAIVNQNMLWLRLIHGISAIVYIWYGLLIVAYPLILGGFLFLIIHTYYLIKIIKNKKTPTANE